MASDERPDDPARPKRRAKAPVITLEATEVTPAEPAGEPVPPAGAEPEAIAPEPGDPSVAPQQPEADAAGAPTDKSEPAITTEPIQPTTEASVPPAAEPVAEPPPPAPEPSPAPNSAGFGRLAAAGLIGAVIAGLGGYAAQKLGVLPGADRSEVAGLERRIAELDTALRAVAARPTPDLAPLSRRLDALDQERSQVEGRVGALEKRTAEGVAGGPATSADLAQLNRDVEALKASIAALSSSESQGRVAGTEAAPDQAAADARVQALMAPQTERIDTVQSRLQGLADGLKAETEATQGLAARVAALDAARAQANAAGQRAAQLVAIEMVRSALDRGASYAPELRALKALGANAEALQPLEAASERGLPTMPVLARRFSDLSAAIVRAAPRPSDGSLFDRLAANAQSLIRIRPIGEAAGDDAPIVVGRIEAKLARGDLAGALADFDRLPEPSKAAARDWERDARARLAAEAALKQMADQAIGTLATR
jgi:hypothetical protein